MHQPMEDRIIGVPQAGHLKDLHTGLLLRVNRSTTLLAIKVVNARPSLRVHRLFLSTVARTSQQSAQTVHLSLALHHGP